MKKQLVFAFSLIIAIGAFGVASAQFERPGWGRETKPFLLEERNELKEKMQGKMMAEREAMKEKMKTQREAFRAELATKREAFRAEVEERKDEFRAATRETKLQFWSGAKRMLGERFSVAVRNLERMQARVEQIIDNLAAAGKTTDKASTLLATSKQKLGEAKNVLVEIEALIPASGEEVTPEIFEQIKLKARQAKDLLKESHRYLVDTIKELKELRGAPENE